MGRPIQLAQKNYNYFCPTLADLKSPAKLSIGYVTEHSTNQIRQGETCRPITEISSEKVHTGKEISRNQEVWVPNLPLLKSSDMKSFASRTS